MIIKDDPSIKEIRNSTLKKDLVESIERSNIIQIYKNSENLYGGNSIEIEFERDENGAYSSSTYLYRNLEDCEFDLIKIKNILHK